VTSVLIKTGEDISKEDGHMKKEAEMGLLRIAEVPKGKMRTFFPRAFRGSIVPKTP
jgi:hypothetical protein